MGKPWAELSSAERMDAILLAVEGMRHGDGTGNAIAWAVNEQHRMDMPKTGRHDGSNVHSRQMALATRVTPGITALRKRGLLSHTHRRDGLSGTADVLTLDGREYVRETISKQTPS